MKVSKTLKHKITNQTRIFRDTLIIYNQALSYMIKVIDKEFIDLSSYTTKDMTTLVEKLIHTTKKNPTPKYRDFNILFYKFPSYFRRSAISSAFGKVKSYRSNLNNWKEEKKIARLSGKGFKKKPPTLQLTHKEFPVFYKGNMFERTSDTTANIKVYKNNDWVWISIIFKGQDLFKRDVYDAKENNPKLVKTGKKFFLHISYDKKVKLNKTKLKDQTIIAVDLGITNSAVCCAMKSDGTVVGRKFINQPTEKDRLFTITNKLRKAQSISGYISAPNFWKRITGLQTHIINHTCHEILAFAKKYNADVIVFEYLNNMKVPKGFFGAKRLRFKLRFWRKKAIQNKCEEMAHYIGVKIRRVNPKNTSALAFDGSGKVKRNHKKDLCTFTTGKQYHADLNASYNIAARYFIKEYQKTISEKKWLSLQAKVPELTKRTSQTLSSFISLYSALFSPKVRKPSLV